MRVEEFSQTLSSRLHAELDEFPVPARGWMTARPSLHRRMRRRRLRRAVAAIAAVTAVAGMAVVAITAIHGSAGARRAEPQAPAWLPTPRQLTSRSFGGNAAPQPAAQLAYGDGRLFAELWGQRQARLLRLDPVSLRVTGSLRVTPDSPLAYGDGAVWVLGSSGTQLWRIDPVTLRVTRRLPIRGQLTALAFGDGTLWLTVCSSGPVNGSCNSTAGGGGQRLDRIDPASGRVTQSGTIPIASDQVTMAVGRVILVSGADSPVFALDPSTLAIRQRFHVNCDGCQGATGVAVGPDGLYAVSINTVVSLDLSSGRVMTQGPQLPFSFAGTLEAAGDGLWLSTEQGTIRLDPVTLAPTTRVIAAGQQLVGTGDTEQAVVAGESVYVSYSGGLARYGGSVSH